MTALPVLTIYNEHSKASPDAPPLATSPALRTAYFESDLGEQWVLQYNRELEEAWLWGGDVSWDRHRVLSCMDGYIAVRAATGKPMDAQPL